MIENKKHINFSVIKDYSRYTFDVNVLLITF